MKIPDNFGAAVLRTKARPFSNFNKFLTKPLPKVATFLKLRQINLSQQNHSIILNTIINCWTKLGISLLLLCGPQLHKRNMCHLFSCFLRLPLLIFALRLTMSFFHLFLALLFLFKLPLYWTTFLEVSVHVALMGGTIITIFTPMFNLVRLWLGWVVLRSPVSRVICLSHHFFARFTLDIFMDASFLAWRTSYISCDFL